METNDIFEQMACRYDTEDRVNTAKIIVQAVRSELVNTKGKLLWIMVVEQVLSVLA
ncbi:MAG: hypothetical protein ABFC94_16120 [Syntrophomonas sp.]